MHYICKQTKDLTTTHKSLKINVDLHLSPESQDPPKTPVPAELGAELCADRSDSPTPGCLGPLKPFHLWSGSAWPEAWVSRALALCGCFVQAGWVSWFWNTEWCKGPFYKPRLSPLLSKHGHQERDGVPCPLRITQAEDRDLGLLRSWIWQHETLNPSSAVDFKCGLDFLCSTQRVMGSLPS